MTATANVLIDGAWREADATGTFQAENPGTGKKLDPVFPISSWTDCDRALTAATAAAHALESIAPEKVAGFLEAYASAIESVAGRLAEVAHEETGLPITPRLKDVEIPRTVDQLRQSARAARDNSWRRITIDAARNLRSALGPVGPVVIFGPNNFPFAYNAVSGGDFASAIAAGNPVIAKGHPLHPHTTQLLAEQAAQALEGSGLPAATVQMVYHVDNDTGIRLVSDSRVGSIGFTGSRPAGLALKHAADEAGKPVYLEMSSLNPVVFLPAGMRENAAKWAAELADSCTAGAGQFCTRPNLAFAFADDATEGFLREVQTVFENREPHAMLSAVTRERLHSSIEGHRKAGAELVTGGKNLPGDAYRYANTLLRVSGDEFLQAPEEFQKEAFGNEILVVTVADEQQLLKALDHLEGNLTGSIYSSTTGKDEPLYARVAPLLRRRVGRFLNDKMPTGVAVSAAMNHGGPYPSTGHPGFTAVGIPGALARFAALHSYDNVRENRLPSWLRGDPPKESR